IYVLLVMMLKLSSHTFQKNSHLEYEVKNDKKMQILKELHNFHNSLYYIPIQEKLIDSPAKSISDK
ncbi:MAG: hypothetical protein ABI851_16620, partial [Saprospiraceae bacterium]